MNQALQPVNQIPTNIEQIAEQQGLGSSKGLNFYNLQKTPGNAATMAFFIAIFLVVTIGLGPVTALFATGTILGGQIALGLAAFIVILSAILAYNSAKNHQDDLCAAYTEGFIQRSGKKIRVFRWLNIEHIIRGRAKAADAGGGIADLDIIKIKQQDGSKFETAPGWNKEFRAWFCDLVEREVTHARLPGLLESFQAGHTLTFGELKISQQEIVQQTLGNPPSITSWNRLEKLEVGPEYVIIRIEGRTSDWYHKLISDVPNTNLLKNLLDIVRSNPSNL